MSDEAELEADLTKLQRQYDFVKRGLLDIIEELLEDSSRGDEMQERIEDLMEEADGDLE